MNPNYQRKIGLLPNSGGKEVYIWNPGDSMGGLLVLLCPRIKVNETLWQPIIGRTIEDSEPLGMKFRSPQQAKTPSQLRFWLRRKWNRKWAVEKESQRPGLITEMRTINSDGSRFVYFSFCLVSVYPYLNIHTYLYTSTISSFSYPYFFS